MRILIAEDDFTTRAMLATVLRKAGHEVVETVNGAEAWEEMQKPDAPRLAILDWMMPEMDGIDLCRKIRLTNSTDPPYLIMLTSRGDESSIVKGLEAGANDYLTKPYKTSELWARIGVGQRTLALQMDLNRANSALAYEARHDPLTGVLNRRAILEYLALELSRVKRGISDLSIGLCDIDHFKKINDVYGHLVGDHVLKAFAMIIKERLRDYDLFGRYGGEEFLLVLPGVRPDTGGNIYEHLRSLVAETEIETRSVKISITVSMGVAGYLGRESVDEVLQAADEALYRAKRNGRNCVAYSDNRMKEDES